MRLTATSGGAEEESGSATPVGQDTEEGPAWAAGQDRSLGSALQDEGLGPEKTAAADNLSQPVPVWEGACGVATCTYFTTGSECTPEPGREGAFLLQMGTWLQHLVEKELPPGPCPDRVGPGRQLSRVQGPQTVTVLSDFPGDPPPGLGSPSGRGDRAQGRGGEGRGGGPRRGLLGAGPAQYVSHRVS